MASYFLDAQGNKTLDASKGVTVVVDNPGGNDLQTTLPGEGLFIDPTDNVVWIRQGGKLYEVASDTVSKAGIDTSTLPKFEFGQIISPELGFVKGGVETDIPTIQSGIPKPAVEQRTTTTTGAIENTPQAIGALQGLTPEYIASEQERIQSEPGYGATPTGTATQALDIAAGATPTATATTGNTNPFFGIPASISSQFNSAEQATQYNQLVGGGMQAQAALQQVLASTTPSAPGSTPDTLQPTGDLVKVSSLKTFQEIAKSLGITPQNESQFIVRKGADIYLKPEALQAFTNKDYRGGVTGAARAAQAEAAAGGGAGAAAGAAPSGTSTAQTGGAGAAAGAGGATATDVLSSLGLPEIPSISDIIADVLGSAEYKVMRDRLEFRGLSAQASAEAAKDLLETKYAGEKSALENKLTDRGLAFSGIRGVQVKGLADSLAASKLGVDREMASKIMELDADLMDTILELVSDRIEEAKDGRKEALGFLEDMGLTINPFTGELTPTLAAIKEERSAAMDEARFGLDVAKANKPTVSYETAGGRRLMIVTDVNGNIINKIDLGDAYKQTGGAGGTGVGTAGLSGKYSEEFLAQRANDYITADGTIDWLAVDELQNTDKTLWSDMSNFLLQVQKAQIAEDPTIPADQKAKFQTMTKEELANIKGYGPGFAAEYGRLLTYPIIKVGEGIQSLTNTFANFLFGS